MKILKTVRGLQRNLKKLRDQGKTIGFTPTMGALHSGHLSLTQLSQDQNDVTVVCIFVNPTQFNESSDLDNYPRPIENDTKLLREQKVDFLFLPSVKEVYPKNINTKVVVDLEGLDAEMEGAFRPGHFEGVVQVVHRLLTIVEPQHLYMGQKDFQQFTIIQKMIDVLSMDVSLVVCPIIREPHGLAKSSRNERLTPTGRQTAKIIRETLQWISDNIQTNPVHQLIATGTEALKKAGLKPEYILIADGNSLQSVTKIDGIPYLVVCCAAWIDGIRLIDNMILRKPDRV